ncbi:T9SS type A sorting domain-containing protein [Yeosuana sp.]|uniref:T9SS type A sorting domain-containing protein n=1 Tax=Yeosuana sp. TaxID=2529388 RepID=UPI004054A966
MVLSTIIYGQNVTVSIENVTVNGVGQSNTATIEMGTSSSVNVIFRVDLSKLASYSIGPSKVWISVFNSSGGRTDHYISDVSESQFITGASNNYNFPIQASEIDFGNGNYLSALLKQNNSPGAEWESQHIPINKTPTFELLPTSLNLPCNDTSPRIFTVSNPPSISGTLTYNWQVGNGWEYEGNAVSNFTTSTNSVALVPTSFPPSNVKVTPVLNGDSYSQLTSTVSLKDYNPSYSISGNSSICLSSTPEVYSIANLPSDVTVTWSSSNTAIATVNSTTGSSTTVNLLSNGTFNLNARVTNSCGQYLDIPPKRISVGNPEITRLMHISTFGCTMGEINVSVNGNAELFEWQVSGGEIVIPNSGTSYIGGGTIFVDPSDTNFGFTVKVRAINSCGYSSWYTEYIPTSCDPDDGGGVTPLSIDPETEIYNTTIEVYPNPVDTELTILSGNNILSKIELYNSKGKLVLKKSNPQNIEVINVSKIPNGIYSLLLLGETKTVKKIIVQH